MLYSTRVITNNQCKPNYQIIQHIYIHNFDLHLLYFRSRSKNLVFSFYVLRVYIVVCVLDFSTYIKVYTTILKRHFQIFNGRKILRTFYLLFSKKIKYIIIIFIVDVSLMFVFFSIVIRVSSIFNHFIILCLLDVTFYAHFLTNVNLSKRRLHTNSDIQEHLFSWSNRFFYASTNS